MAGEKKSILLRIDPKLAADLQRWADDELRSLNGQMEWILREAVRLRSKGSSASHPQRGAGHEKSQ